MKKSPLSRAQLASGVVLMAAGTALAQTDSFHLMQIQEVIGGVNGDASKQAIQLRQRSAFQNLINNGRLVAYNAAGLSPVVLSAPATTVPNFNTGDTVLFASAAFPCPVTPDIVLTNTIPASYLPAGRLTWEDNFGTILWSISWGGAAYTGSNIGSVTNSPTGNFGPSWGSPLPSSGLQSLLFLGSATAPAGANATDYAVTAGASVWTNNARASGTLAVACYPNCDGSTAAPVLNVNDFQCFLNKFAVGDPYANCDGSSIPPVLNVNDFSCFLNKFAAGCS